MRSSRLTRWPLLGLALALAVTTMGAQVRTPALGVVQQVRVDLAHGDLEAARRAAYSTTGNAADRDLAQALVDMFEGKDADARIKLTPHATARPLSDASLELALLDLRTGRVDEARRRLDAL